MTSDYDNDEIIDSSFPVDFGTESDALDMYGVWVKSGPRDASAARHSSSPIVTATSNESEEFLELPDLPDLPDVPLREDDVPLTDETIMNLDDLAIMDVSEAEMPSFELESLDESFDDALVDSEELDITRQSRSEERIDTLEDISFDDTLDVTFDESQEESPSVTANVTADLSSIAVRAQSTTDEDESLIVDFAESDFTLDLPELPSDVFSSQAAQDDSSEIKATDTESDAAFFGDAQSVDETIEDLSADFADELSDTLPDMEIPLDDGGYPVIDQGETLRGDSLPADLPTDDVFSDFLNDLNSSDAIGDAQKASSDTLDLDSFISEFNETGGTPVEEQDKLFEDVDPVEIDLDFDESFIEDSERIRASGSSVSEHEFSNSEFGVELVDETAGSEDASFDNMISGIVDPSAMPLSGGSVSQESSELESASEFDDLLASLDTAPVTQTPKENRKPAQTANTFDLHVTEEDGLSSVAANVTADRLDEDISVALFQGETDELTVRDSLGDLQGESSAAIDEEENLDILEIKDYNSATSMKEAPQRDFLIQDDEVSLEFDDISAVEQELSDGTPETGDDAVVSNDKSTELLMVIADELSSIKQEISTLKAELAGFKGVVQSSDTTSSSDADTTDNSGFFSDDDNDEAIALTGDELNNILITADFTEEKTEDAPQEPEEDVTSGFIEEETPTVDIGFLNETALSSDEPEIPETLPDSIFDIPDLDTSDEISIHHVTTIEDDIGYLDGTANHEPDLDNVAIEEPELETIDFNDEKLEEPELTEFNIDLADIENGFPAEQTVAIDSFEPLAAEIEFPPLANDSPDTLETPSVPVNDNTSKQDNLINDVSGVTPGITALPVELKDEIKSVLSYMDQLLESLPEEKIEEFARSEHFEVYRKLFEELGIS